MPYSKQVRLSLDSAKPEIIETKPRVFPKVPAVLRHQQNGWIAVLLRQAFTALWGICCAVVLGCWGIYFHLL